MNEKIGMECITYPCLIPIKWRPDYYSTYNQVYDACDSFGELESITLFSHDISGINFELTLSQLETSSLIKKKLHDDSLLMVTSIELRRSLRNTHSSLKALNVQGSIFFVEGKSHQRLADKSFKHLFKEGEEYFSFDLEISKHTLPKKYWETTVILWNIHGYVSLDYPYMETDQYCFESCPDREAHKLSNDLQFLEFDKNHFSDFTIKCCGVSFFVHRIILASRSPVFKAMLQKSTKEYETGEINISDIAPDIMKIMLKYIYCAQIDELDEDTACYLLYAARKYELTELKEMCVSYLKTRISNDNIFHILNVAAQFDDVLKLYAIDHIEKNFMEIEKTSDWEKLRKHNSYLVMDILSHIVKFK